MHNVIKAEAYKECIERVKEKAEKETWCSGGELKVYRYTIFAELVKDGDWNFNDMISNVADYLLANGVIVIPCNVGQTVYTIFERKIETLEITQAKTKESKNGIRIDCIAENDFLKMPFSKCHIGNSIFLTKQEAEAKLKEQENGCR